jgi:hypothetical protein
VPALRAERLFACGLDHAAVADEDGLADAELLLQQSDLFTDSAGIGGVALNTRTAGGSPSVPVSKPMTICFLPSR